MGEEQKRLDGTTVIMKKIGRVQSPSSINTYKRCPRKYYYHYIAGLPTKHSIHLIKGGVIHHVLEDFYDIDIARYDERTVRDELRLAILKLFLARWQECQDQIRGLGIADIDGHTNDCLGMLSSWAEWYVKRLDERLERGVSLQKAFDGLKPKREQEYVSDEHAVHGFIDAVHEDEGKVAILDYKTSSSDEITDEYYVQLAIYALLYRVRHGRLPDTVGLHFLRHGEKHLEVTEKLVDFAKETVEEVHARTQSAEKKDYPKKANSWCRFCDFYSTCIKDR